MKEPATIQKRAECPNGHVLKLEVQVGTPNMIQTIQCPACNADIVVIAGTIASVALDNG
jgi:hypothetical protein